MSDDPIVDEVHRIRDELARQFDYDVHKICEDMRSRDGRLGKRLISVSESRELRREKQAQDPSTAAPTR